MPRMKHLFRKLHIGGGAAAAPHRLPEIPSPTAPLPPESTAGGSRCAAPGGGFNFLEEEYQVQLALALSASDRAGLEGPDSVQMKAAARMSLGAGDAAAMEHLSFRYWSYNIVDYHEKLVDGFYVVRDITSSHNLQGRMPSLLDLQRIPVSDNIDYEVVLVNRAVDQALRQLERRAISIALESRAAKVGTLASGLVQKIANLVVDSMGGPVGDTEDMLRRWTMRSYELRTCLKTIVLPLGSLDVGLSCHRALLFKVLADRINLPCRLVKGSYYTGTDEGAINFIKVDNSQYILDLMGAPGVLIPAESLSDFFQTSGPRLLSSSAIEQTTLDVCMPLDKVGYQLGKISEESERSSSTTDTRSGTVYLQPEEKSGVIPLAEVFSVDATQRFEHEFGELSSLGSQKVALFENKEVTSPAQQMKLDDVSKYVVDAAKNPEFAQKLHAILLKSRDPRPPVLFSELNPSLNSLEQKGIERSISMEKKIQEGGPPQNNLPLDSQSCFTAVDSSDLAGASGKVEVIAETTQKQDGNVICTGIHADAEIPLPIEMSGLVSHVKGRNAISMAYSDSERTEWEIPWENLQIGERIGIGSYGEVCRADWNGTEVAVKKFLDQDLSGDALEQIRSEIKIMLRLRHPNVILFMGAITCPPNLSILTEFLPRGSLYKLLHRPNVRLDEKRRLKMAVDVAKGMNYLHTSHPTIVHRDLKSPNLLVDKNWIVKVCDFGLSQLKHHTFLSSKSAAGTPEWMAPEVLRNEPSNEKCDVYSFAVILWELATLQMPWSGMNPMQVVGAVGFQNRRLDIPKEVDPMVAEIISDCWQNDPNQRPSFAQLIPRLRQLKRLVVADDGGPPG